MKKLIILSMFMAGAISLFTACNSKQTVDQFLMDDTQRKDIITALVHHPSYRMEMMREMMNNDSCKQMMGQNMMKDPGMMSMMMSDSSMMHNMMNGNKNMQNRMMGQMMDMAEKDSVMCDAMMRMMNEKPQIKSRMMKMNMSNTKSK